MLLAIINAQLVVACKIAHRLASGVMQGLRNGKSRAKATGFDCHEICSKWKIDRVGELVVGSRQVYRR